MTVELMRDLRHAYLATRYLFADGDREVAVRIGQASPELDALLARHGAAGAAFITAWNPGSRASDPAENLAAAERLQATVDALGLVALAHRGVPDETEWVPEEGLLVLDIGATAAVAIAEAFGQNAIVHIAPGGAAELVLTRLMPR
ncbi:MAG TPA: DUF3293 domain-containing protein [Aliidongia sp.]|nr:DUF3293 domain-containing protein [Aliidongia sp.]